MSFMCNTCFVLMENGKMPGGPCIFTTCFHILCNACSKRIRNNECTVCAKQCKIVEIGKDMPMALKNYFEPPLTRIGGIQQQLRFLQQQQQITLKLEKTVEAARKKRADRIQKIIQMEQQAVAEEKRLMESVREKTELFKNIKGKYQKLHAEEQRLLKFFKDNGYSVDKDLSADSGMHSFERSARFEH